MPDGGGGGGGGGVSMSINGQSRVPPGFRFHPTEEELLQYYLRKKVGSLEIDLDVIVEVDLNKLEPWDIQEKCAIGSTPQNDWYFFSHKDKKYPTGTRTNRATAAGFWKATGRDKVIYGGGRRIGMRKTLVFYKGRAPHGQKSDWIMHEYRLIDHNAATTTTAMAAAVETGQEEGWVVCKIFKKKHLVNHSHSHSRSHNNNDNKSPLSSGDGMIITSSSSNTIVNAIESYQGNGSSGGGGGRGDCCDGGGALEQIFQHITQQTTHQLINNNNNNSIVTADDEDHNNKNNGGKNVIGNYSRTGGGLCNDNYFMKLPSLESPNSNADHQHHHRPRYHTKLGNDQLAYDGNGNGNGSYDHLNNLISSSTADRWFKVGVGGSALGGGGFGELMISNGVGYSEDVTAADDDDHHDGLSDWGTIDLLVSSHLNSQQHPLPPPPPPPPPPPSSTSSSSSYYLHHHHHHQQQQQAAAGHGNYFSAAAAAMTASGDGHDHDQINEAWELITSSRSSLLSSSSSDLLL